jgi:glucose/arabinose dehydrogenase
MNTSRAALVAAAALLATPALADSMQTLGNMLSTGKGAPIPHVTQTGPEVDAIKDTLKKIKLPEGFHIKLYAVVPGAREIAVGPQGVVTFVGTRDKIYSVVDRSHSGVADEVKEFAPTLPKVMPTGVCFTKDGFLISAEQNRVVSYPAAEFFFEGADVAVGELVKQGELIPKDAESFNHTFRYCKVGPDKKVYVTIGQPYNVPPPDRQAEFLKVGIGAIIRMDAADGKNREIFANGIRNSVGMAFDPKDKTLWFTDNQVDGMGDDIPPGEINHASKMGQNFGFPWYGGGHTRTKEYAKDTPPADIVFPVVEEVAHAADLGMTVYTGHMFPEKYRGAIFSAQHGSWNRTEPVGARVMLTTVDKDGKGKSEPFAEGWLDSEGSYSGRPVDVEQMRDGSLLVSDDFAGAVYRITYDGK